jgi:hypothetical protein
MQKNLIGIYCRSRYQFCCEYMEGDAEAHEVFICCVTPPQTSGVSCVNAPRVADSFIHTMMTTTTCYQVSHNSDVDPWIMLLPHHKSLQTATGFGSVCMLAFCNAAIVCHHALTLHADTGCRPLALLSGVCCIQGALCSRPIQGRVVDVCRSTAATKKEQKKNSGCGGHKILNLLLRSWQLECMCVFVHQETTRVLMRVSTSCHAKTCVDENYCTLSLVVDVSVTQCHSTP